MKTILSAIYATLAATNPVYVAIIAPALALMAFFQWLNQQMGNLITKLDTLTASSFSGTLNFSPFALLNTFIPLQEAITLFTAFLAVLLLCTVIRMIKAFVPTIAS